MKVKVLGKLEGTEYTARDYGGLSVYRVRCLETNRTSVMGLYGEVKDGATISIAEINLLQIAAEYELEEACYAG